MMVHMLDQRSTSRGPASVQSIVYTIRPSASISSRYISRQHARSRGILQMLAFLRRCRARLPEHTQTHWCALESTSQYRGVAMYRRKHDCVAARAPKECISIWPVSRNIVSIFVRNEHIFIIHFLQTPINYSIVYYSSISRVRECMALNMFRFRFARTIWNAMCALRIYAIAPRPSPYI